MMFWLRVIQGCFWIITVLLLCALCVSIQMEKDITGYWFFEKKPEPVICPEVDTIGKISHILI